ncbi:MAG: hypothetical protein KKF44_03545 [Nanoarchaeota archaeon]|nr:hypothetical protein [Nanoarchaeota archaeon]
MKKRLAQAAMEYIVIIGIVFMFLIPGMYLFRNYVETSNDRIIEQKINQLAGELINTAREMYFFGVPSKRVIEVEMPEEVANMAVYFNEQDPTDKKDDEYTLIIVVESSGSRINYYYQFDVPILPHEVAGWFCNTPDLTNSDGIRLYDGADNYDYEQNCGVDDFQKGAWAPTSLDTRCFPPRDFSSGIKNFKLETIKSGTKDPENFVMDCYAGGGTTCVIIDEVSNEINCFDS